jgi:hypothetical protein
MRMSRREQEIIAHAEKASARLVDMIPMFRTVHKTNAERVVSLCREFVTSKPIREPTSPALEEVGKIRYPKFPAQQSLLNRYRELLRIWRKAFYDLVSVTAPVPRREGEAFIDAVSLQSLDAGTRAQIGILEALLKEQKRENDRLRKLLRQTLPVPVPASYTVSSPNHELAPVKQWLRELGHPDSYLEVDDAGARLSRNARPRVLIMDADVLSCLSRLCGTPTRQDTSSLE